MFLEKLLLKLKILKVSSFVLEKKLDNEEYKNIFNIDIDSKILKYNDSEINKVSYLENDFYKYAIICNLNIHKLITEYKYTYFNIFIKRKQNIRYLYKLYVTAIPVNITLNFKNKSLSFSSITSNIKIYSLTGNEIYLDFNKIIYKQNHISDYNHYKCLDTKHIIINDFKKMINDIKNVIHSDYDSDKLIYNLTNCSKSNLKNINV